MTSSLSPGPVQCAPSYDRRLLLRSIGGACLGASAGLLLGHPTPVDAAMSDTPKYPSAPARTLHVPEDYRTLAAAYSVAGPGDHISLASGDYAGDLTLDRSGSPDQPIIIRSRSPLGAALTGRITITGSHHWLYELRTSWNTSSKDGYAVNLKGSYVTITRCWFASNQAIQCDRNGRHHIWIGWNRFTGQNRTSMALSQIFFDQPPGGKWSVAENGPNNVWIYRNFFWDNIGAGAEDHCIYFGHTRPSGNDIGRMLNVSIEYNLIHRDNKRTRGFYVKRGCDLLYNQMDCIGNFTVRHGWGSRCWGNRLQARPFSFNGGRSGLGHDIRGNVSSRPLLLHCGGYAKPENPFQAADYALLVGNTVPQIKIGYLNSGHRLVADQGGPVNNVTVHLAGRMSATNVVQTPGLCDPGTCLTSASDGGFAIPSTVTLTQSDVGLELANQTG